MSAIGLGCWQFGSMEWGYGKDYLEKDAIDIVHRALDLGVTLVDTAEIYGFGKSERAVGRALEGRRDDAFVATKVFPVLPIAPIVEQRGRRSAGRLGIDRIDLYQIHQPNPLVPISNQMAGMRKLQEAGVASWALATSRRAVMSSWPRSRFSGRNSEFAARTPPGALVASYFAARKPWASGL